MYRNMFRTSNPVYKNIRENATTSSEAVTRQGVGIKTMILLLLAIGSAIAVAFGINIDLTAQTIEITRTAQILMISSGILLLVGMIGTWFSVNPIFAIMYSIGYGATIGLVSLFMEIQFPGIVLMAVAGTVSIFLAMLSLYNLGIVKVNNKFRAVVFGMLLGYVLFSFAIFILGFFMGGITETFFGANSMGIAIGAVAVLLGALMLAIDFDNIAQFADNGVDKKYEWRLAFGLTITILWIYVELLKLIARILQSQRR